MINFKDLNISNIYNGQTEASAVYLGSTKMWPDNPSVVIGGSEVNPSESKACDICFYDSTEDKVIIVDGDKWSIESYSASRYTPIGIVVVPGAHDVYGDGSCGVMSLKEMNHSTPNTGSTSYQVVYFGQYGIDILNLSNLNKVCIVGTNLNVGDASSTVIGEYATPRLPSDKFSAVLCPHDTDVYYSSNGSLQYAPSPYLTDGSRNSAYYQTSSPSSSSNALADFNGRSNSKILWNLATAQSDWQTASSIVNNSDNGYSPAACCCWKYHTDGTQQGDWYLPACGELGYMMPLFNKINTAITNMQNAYGASVGVALNTDYSY